MSQIRDSRVTLGRTSLLGKKFIRRVTINMDMQTGRRGNLKKSPGSSAVASRQKALILEIYDMSQRKGE